MVSGASVPCTRATPGLGGETCMEGENVNSCSCTRITGQAVPHMGRKVWICLWMRSLISASTADLIDIDRPVHQSLDPETCRQHHRNLVLGGKQGQVTISLENLWDAVKMLGRRWFNDLDINHIVNACPSLLQLLVIAASPRAFKTEGKKNWKKPLWNCSTTFPEVQAQSEISPGCGSSG